VVFLVKYGGGGRPSSALYQAGCGRPRGADVGEDDLLLLVENSVDEEY
jgi:hypothetical protein